MVESNCTPRRSPRLLSRIKTPVRDRLRMCIQEKLPNSSFQLTGLQQFINATQETASSSSGYSSLSLDLVKANMGNNIIKPFLIVTRKLKSYDDQLGGRPYDALRLIISEDGCYKLICYGKSVAEGGVSVPYEESPITELLQQLLNEVWVTCPGINGYSAFKLSIGVDLDRVVTEYCPPNSVRDSSCIIFYKQQPKSKSLVCSNCTSLKWLLTKRKKEHDEMPVSQRQKRQSSSSSVPFKVLSPHSQQARVENMRKTIKTLQLRSDYYSKKNRAVGCQ